MGNILSLWVTLSVERCKQFCLEKQSPFDSIPEEFLRELSIDEDGVDQKVELRKCLPKFDDIGVLLNDLYELIETYIKYIPKHEASWT